MEQQDLRELQKELQKKIAKAKPVVDKVAKKELLHPSEEEQRLLNNYPKWLEDLECVKKGEMPSSKKNNANEVVPVAATKNNQKNNNNKKNKKNADDDDDDSETPAVVHHKKPNVAAAEVEEEEQQHQEVEYAAAEEDVAVSTAACAAVEEEEEDVSEATSWADLTHRQLLRRLLRSTKAVRKAQIEAFVIRNVDSSQVLALTKQYESLVLQKRSDENATSDAFQQKVDAAKKNLQQEQAKVRAQSDRLRNGLAGDVAKLEQEIAAAAEAAAQEQKRQQQAANAAKKEEKRKAVADRKQKEDEEKAKEAARLLAENERKLKEANAFNKNDDDENPFEAPKEDFSVQADPEEIAQEQEQQTQLLLKQKKAEADAAAEAAAAAAAEKAQNEEAERKNREAEKAAEADRQRQLKQQKEQEEAEKKRKQKEAEEEEKRRKQQEKEEREAEAARAKAEAEAAAAKKAKEQKSLLESSSDGEVSDDTVEEEVAEAAPAPEDDDDDMYYGGGGGDMFDLGSQEKMDRRAARAKRRDEKAARRAKREEYRAAVARGENPFGGAGGGNSNNNGEEGEGAEDVKQQPAKEIDWSVIAIEKNHRRTRELQQQQQMEAAAGSSSNPTSPKTADAEPATPPSAVTAVAPKLRHWIFSSSSTSSSSSSTKKTENSSSKQQQQHHIASRINAELELCRETVPDNVSIPETFNINNNNNNDAKNSNNSNKGKNGSSSESLMINTTSAVWRINVTPHDGALAGHVIPLSLTFTPYYPFEAPVLQVLVDGLASLHPLVAAVSATGEFRNVVEYDRQKDGGSSIRPRSTSRSRTGSASGATRTSSRSKTGAAASNATSTSSSSTRGAASTRTGRNTSAAVSNNATGVKVDDITLRSTLTPAWSPLSSVSSIMLCISKVFDAKFLPTNALLKNSPVRVSLFTDALRTYFTDSSSSSLPLVGLRQVFNGPWKKLLPTTSSSSATKRSASPNNKTKTSSKETTATTNKKNTNNSNSKNDDENEIQQENKNLVCWDHRYGSGKHSLAVDWRDSASAPNVVVGVKIFGGKFHETVLDSCHVDLLSGEMKLFQFDDGTSAAGAKGKNSNKFSADLAGPVLVSIAVVDDAEVEVTMSSPVTPGFKFVSKFKISSSASEENKIVTAAPFIINNEEDTSENLLQTAFSLPSSSNDNNNNSNNNNNTKGKENKNNNNKSSSDVAFFREQTTSIVTTPSFCVISGNSFSTTTSASASANHQQQQDSAVVLGVGVELSRSSTTGLLTAVRSSAQVISSSVISRIVGLRDANGLRIDAFLPVVLFDVGANKTACQNAVQALKTSIMMISRRPAAASATTIQSGTVALYTPPFVASTAAKTCALLLDGCVSDLLLLLANSSSSSSSAAAATANPTGTKSNVSGTFFLAESVVTRYIGLVYNFALLASQCPQMQEFATKTVSEWKASAQAAAGTSAVGLPFAYTTITSDITWQSATRKTLETVVSIAANKNKAQAADITAATGEAEVFNFMSGSAPLAFRHSLLACSLAAPFCKVTLAALLPLLADAKEVAKIRTAMMAGIQNVQSGNVKGWSGMDEHFGVLLRVGDIVQQS